MVGLEMSKARLNALAFIPLRKRFVPISRRAISRASDGEALRSGRHEWRCNDGQADTKQQTHTGNLGDCITASTLMRFSIHTGGDSGARPQIIVSSTWRTGRITQGGPPSPRPPSKPRTDDISQQNVLLREVFREALAPRRRVQQRFGRFRCVRDGRRSIHNMPARPPSEILAPFWIKSKRQSTIGAVRGGEASLAR